MDNPLDRQSPADETVDGRAGNMKPPAYPPELVRALHGPVTEGPGSRVGRYKLIQKLGEGGFGIVFQAEQERPVRRTLALKIIKLGMDTPQVLARFDAERQALAMMDHPNIARVVDAGVTDTGRPYFVMELVKGIAITEYCDRHELPIDERLELFHSVCLAVQHAHQKGIIHRDLKPSNILVTIRDGKPVPKIIDFGIAKATSGRLTDMTLHTELNEMIGTPQYMSPEQAEMTALDIDTRSDIYSLGVLLYELLTGATPLDGHTLRTAALVDMQRIIREAEPQRPSVKLATLGVAAVKVAISRRTDVIRLGKKLRGELDWIVLKAMEKDRTRRYDTAQGLALEVRRYLTDEPVLARPASAAYRTQKFVRKHKVAVFAGSIVAVALILGIAGTSIATVRAAREKNRAVAAERAATEQKNQVIGLLAEVRSAEGNARRSAAEAIAAKRESDLSHARGRITQGDAQGAAGDWSSARDAYAAARTELKALGASPRAAEFGLWDSYRNLPPPLAVKSLGNKPIVGVEWLADGRSAIALSQDGRLTIWDVPTGRTLREFHDTVARPSYWMALSPDRANLITLRDHKTIVIWDLAKGEIVKELPELPYLRRAVFSRDGTRIIAGENTWAKVLEFPGGNVLFDHDHKKSHFDMDYDFLPMAMADPSLLITTWYGGVCTWDTQTDKVVHIGRGPTLSHDYAAISPDGSFMVCGEWAGMLRRWDFQGGKLLDFTSQQEGAIKAIAFSAADRVVSVASDGEICEWDTTTRTLVRHLGKDTSHSRHDCSLALAPGGRTILSTEIEGTVSLWSLGASREARSFVCRPNGYDDGPSAVAVLPDNCTAVIGAGAQAVGFWDIATTQILSGDSARETLPGKSKSIRGLFPVAGDKIVCASGAEPNIERLRLWDAQTYKPLPVLIDFKDKRRLKAVQLSKDGRFVIGIDLIGLFHAWDAQTLAECNATPDILGAAPAELTRAMLHTENKLTLSLPTSGISFQHNFHESNLLLVDPVTREEMHKLRHTASVSAAACSPDERWLITGDDGRNATFWDLGRLRDYESFAPRLQAARTALAKNPQDADALLTLGRWYAFRGEPAWGAECLELAGQHGAKISRLMLARCYWDAGNFDAAEREFNTLSANEAPSSYVQHCVDVIQRESINSKEWHDRVNAAMAAKQSIAALTELIQQKPYAVELYAIRGARLGSGGQLAEAAADYDKALEMKEEVNWRFVRGCLRLYGGDQKGYLEDCRKMRDLHIRDADNSRSNQACKLCMLLPGAVTNVGEIAAITDAQMKAEAADPTRRPNEWNKLNKGMAEFRLGHFDAAIPWLSKAEQSSIFRPGIITAELFEAMAQFKAGHVATAKSQLAASLHRIDTELHKVGQGNLGDIDNWLICQIARREAEALIK